MATFTKNQVKLVGKLANMAVSDDEATQLAKDFAGTLDYISNLQQLDTDRVEPTHQVTGLENVGRNDTVDEHRMYAQTQALANAARTHRGYFVVKQVITNDAE